GFAQQQKQVRGKVSDGNNPLPGVSVRLKGAQVATMTDANGSYTIPVTDLNAVLEFSSIGYQHHEEKVGNRSIIQVTLEPSQHSLVEVVGMGDAAQKRINLTGAVDNVSLGDVEDRVLTDASQILQGKSAGVLITQTSGQPGRDQAELRIRGLSSIDN